MASRSGGDVFVDPLHRSGNQIFWWIDRGKLGEQLKHFRSCGNAALGNHRGVRDDPAIAGLGTLIEQYVDRFAIVRR
jgi:hypothetical protein